ncbi:MAG TPA: hypothetical protein VJ206_07490 [bacterium]|nr:hypothetical protein [bacterium]
MAITVTALATTEGSGFAEIHDIAGANPSAVIGVALEVKAVAGGTTYTKAGATLTAAVTSGLDVYEAVKAGKAVCD